MTRPAVEGHSLRSLIDARAEATPDAPFLIDPDAGETLTFADLRSRAAGVAAHLAARGIRPGEAVGYALPNGAASATAILGALYGGYLATAINLVAGPATIGYVLGHSAVRAVFVDATTRPLLEEALGTAEAPPAPPLVPLATDAGDPPPAPAPGTDGLLMYTSGTTGRPKGVILAHSALLAGGANTAEAHRLGAADRALCVLPLYHINGLCVTLMGPLASGGSVVMPRRFSVSAFWPLIADTRASWVSVVPTQISYLLHDPADPPPCPALRFARSASAPLAPEVQEAFETRFGVPIVETMGLTETAAQILSNPLPPGPRKIGSPGVAVGNEVIVAAEDGTERPRGEEGEIRVRGPNVMRLYKDNPEATVKALTADGWFRTGDLGRMDAEGYVFVTGRLKELIIKGGENIAPREIDEALYAHPDVVEAAAFARPSRDYGQTVEAAVSLREGARVTAEELVALAQSRVGRFKAPDVVHLLPELPKGPSGKIQRLKLAELTAPQTAG